MITQSDEVKASFTGFPTLQDMAIQWRTFYPSCDHHCAPSSEDKCDTSRRLIQGLPESIRGLWILDCRYATRPDRLATALDGLAAAKALGRFPELRHVGCEVDAMMRNYNHRGPFGFDKENGVRDALAACGVVVDYGLEWETPSSAPALYEDGEEFACLRRDHRDTDADALPLVTEEEDPDL
ncbi:hypothetical protein PG996_006876 [Apiospora saccharicola]|uniref:Uncharacterized protein n=1 Tax=Apiospora saccharicola TaxID=335842 RepID=A0ABR1V982_9PEZI